MFIQLGDEFIQVGKVFRIRREMGGYVLFYSSDLAEEGVHISAKEFLSDKDLLELLSGFPIGYPQEQVEAPETVKYKKDESGNKRYKEDAVIEAEKDATRALEEHCTREGVDASSMVGCVFDGEEILPTEEVPEQTYEESDVRDAIRNVAKKCGKEKAKEVLSDFSATRISEIPENDYPLVIQKCNTILGD